MATGTQKILGVTIPDLGFTENLVSMFPSLSGTVPTNPNLNPQSTYQQVDYGRMVSGEPATSRYSPSTLGATTAPTQQPSGGGSAPRQTGGEVPLDQQARNMGFQSVEELQAWQRQREEEKLSQQLEASYAPAYQNLSRIQADYEAQFPTTQQEITQSFGQVVPQLEKERETELAGIESQKTSGQAREASELSTAQRLASQLEGKERGTYNALQQGILSRFGGAKSSGLAASEILGRATAQNMGQIGQTLQEQTGEITGKFGQYYQDLEKEASRAKTYFEQKMTQLEEQKQLALRKAQDTFDSKIREINTQRAALDSEKAARRLGALQALAAEYRAINAESQAFAQDLQNWMAMKDQILGQAQQYGATQVTIPGINNRIGQMSMTLPRVGGGTAASATPQGYWGGGEDDIISSWLNA